MIGITNNRDTTRTQSFTYDQVNRIVSGAGSTYAQSSAHCWGETYTYDQWANMSAIGAISSAYTGCAQDNLSVSVTTNNQLSSTGFSYDAAGNMTGDNIYTYGYNAESEIKSAAGVNYTYDGDGNRLEKSSGKIYWYGAGTEILDESDLSGNFTNEYVFFGGRRIAIRSVSSGTIDYYEEDMLGSSRTLVQAGGTSPCFDADFLPFGYEKDVTTTCSQNYKFEGKERDTETGDDDFGARYYTFRLGRWLSADWSSVPAPVPYANLTNPQTLNLYAMVSDNPESFADLDGHQCQVNAPGGISCKPDVPPAAPNTTGNGAAPPKKTDNGGNIYEDGYNQQEVLVVSRTTSTTTTDKNGTETTTVVHTTIDISTEPGHEGQVVNANQVTSTYTAGSPDPKVTNRDIDTKQATQAIGGELVGQAQTLASKPDRLGYFAASVGNDIHDHPGRYLLHAVGLAAGPALGLGAEAEGLITAIHALHTAADLSKETNQ